MKLHIGCGGTKKPGYINIDFFQTRAADVVMDVSKSIDYPDNSVDEISCCHMIEHLYKAEAMKFLDECARVLKKGGILHLEHPLLDVVIARWLSGEYADNILFNSLWGIQRHEGDYHKYGYTEKSMLQHLTDRGFEIDKKLYGREGYGENSPGIRWWCRLKK